MKVLLSIFMGAFMLFSTAVQTDAHVLITDSTKSEGAIVHIFPDDDPIAGEAATIFLDIKNKDIIDVLLRINGTPVTTRFDGSLATAEYIFPAQGEYELQFYVKASQTTYSFTHNQRVNRGLSANSPDKYNNAWAEILILASSLGLILLFIIAVNRRHEIKLQSKW